MRAAHSAYGRRIALVTDTSKGWPVEYFSHLQTDYGNKLKKRTFCIKHYMRSIRTNGGAAQRPGKVLCEFSFPARCRSPTNIKLHTETYEGRPVSIQRKSPTYADGLINRISSPRWMLALISPYRNQDITLGDQGISKGKQQWSLYR